MTSQAADRLRFVTTSWDDGEQPDLRVAEMLRSRGIQGTFYVPLAPYQGRPALSHAELRELSSQGFEIGAHGVSHKALWKLSERELSEEVSPCKPTLEDVLGAEVRMFCYPYGRYDSNVVRALRKAGYWGARTVRMLATPLEFEPFEMPTTIQIAPQPITNYFKNVVRGRKIDGLQACLANFTRLGNWLELGKRLFDSVLQQGGIWHLYGHSREIEDLGMWQALEEMLDYVSGHQGVTYVPNCELIHGSSAQAMHATNGKS